MKQSFPLLSFSAFLGLGWILTPVAENLPADEATLSSRTLRTGPSVIGAEERNQLRDIAHLSSYEAQVHQIIALATSIPVGEIANWHQSDLIDELDGDLEGLFWRITSERWLEADPEGFMKWATTMNYLQADLHLAQWMVKDSEAATRYIMALPKSERGSKLANLIPEMMESDPAKALKFLNENLSTLISLDSYYLGRMVASFEGSNLEALLDARATWPASAQRQSASAILGQLLKQDFSKGMSFLQSEGLNWKSVMGQFDSKLAEVLIDNRGLLPEGVLSQAIESNPWAFRGPNTLDLMESGPGALGISEQSFEQLANISRHLPMNKDNQGRFMALINGETISLKNRQKLLSEKISNWSSKDSEGLREWLGTLDDPELHATADRALAGFDTRPEAKPTYTSDLAKIEAGARLDYNNGDRMSRWTPEETEKAIETFRGLTPEQQRASMSLLRDGGISQSSNFDYTREIFTENSKLPPIEDQNEQTRNIDAFHNFSSNYAMMEPANAAEWAAQLPAGDARQSAIKGVVQSWSEYSPSEVGTWVRTLPAADQVFAKGLLE